MHTRTVAHLHTCIFAFFHKTWLLAYLHTWFLDFLISCILAYLHTFPHAYLQSCIKNTSSSNSLLFHKFLAVWLLLLPLEIHEELSLLKTHETILQKTWIIDKHTFNFETVLKNPKTEIIYWTMCKYLKAQLSLDYQYWTISDNIWLSSQYLTWCNNISTYLIFIKNWTYLDAPRQYFKSSSNSSMILLFWNFLVSHLTVTVTRASYRGAFAPKNLKYLMILENMGQYLIKFKNKTWSSVSNSSFK